MTAPKPKIVRVVVCLWCGETFTTTHPAQHYCGDNCVKRASDLRRGRLLSGSGDNRTNRPEELEPDNGEWRRSAACAGSDVNVFFPPNADYRGTNSRYRESVAAARQICNQCPVRRQCADYATATDQQHGIWGGHTPDELRRIRNRKRRTA